MNAVEAEARCRALVEALWTHNHIITDDTIAGQGTVRIMATIPPMRGMTVAYEVHRSSLGRAWLATLPRLRDIARRTVSQLASQATGYEDKARALREKRQAIRNLLGDERGDR